MGKGKTKKHGNDKEEIRKKVRKKEIRKE